MTDSDGESNGKRHYNQRIDGCYLQCRSTDT